MPKGPMPFPSEKARKTPNKPLGFAHGGPGPKGVQRDRRSFLKAFSWFSMAVALAAATVSFLGIGLRFLFPSRRGGRWVFAALVRDLEAKGALGFSTPEGQGVTLAQFDGETMALSSVCPHLGCKVHWESHKKRFFCPCHNGVFDPQGHPKAGPPADANQALVKYPVKVEKGMVWIRLPHGGLS